MGGKRGSWVTPGFLDGVNGWIVLPFAEGRTQKTWEWEVRGKRMNLVWETWRHNPGPDLGPLGKGKAKKPEEWSRYKTLPRKTQQNLLYRKKRWN